MPTENSKKRWADDVLDRQKLADFLTTSLSNEARLTAERQTGLTVALDSDWGTGKSFFVKRWAEDLRQLGHPVVFFDAWENDIGDEAVIALMARIKGELDHWISRLPIKHSIQQRATQATAEAIKGLRRAVVPATKIIATGLVKKFTGVAVDELIGLGDGDSSSSAKDAASSALESGLDELFKKSLEEHQRRSTAVSDFKDRIGSVIDAIESEAGAIIPVFVFVDEVDRCRPTYAVRLLEEIKHIFGMPKMCFVVSTNILQLQESVRAIYGAGFDGRRYLKRFFDHQYTLPAPNNQGFAAQLFNEPSAFTNRRLDYGLPSSSKPNAPMALAVIAEALGLDLRSLKQVFSVASAVAAVIPAERKIYSLWLFFLCGVHHARPSLLDELQKGIDHSSFATLCRELMRIDVEIKYSSPGNHFDGRNKDKTARLSEVLWSYYSWARDDLVKLRDREHPNAYDYPASNLRSVLEEAPNPYNQTQSYPPSIAQYVEWVKYAGVIERTMAE